MKKIFIIGTSLFSRKVEKYITLDTDIKTSIYATLEEFVNKEKNIGDNLVVYADYFQDYCFTDYQDYFKKGCLVYDKLSDEAKSFVRGHFKWVGSLEDFIEYIAYSVIEDTEYIPIKTSRFLYSRTFNYNIYIKLARKKYLKIWNGRQVYTLNDIQKYIDKGVDYFYVPKKDYINFSRSYLNSFDDLYKNSFRDTKARYVWNKEYLGLIHDKIELLELDRETIDQVNDYSIHLAKQIGSASNDVLNNLEEMFNHPTDITQLSLLMSYFTSMVAKEFEWYSESSMNKLVMASLIHDLSLVATPHLFKKSFNSHSKLQKIDRKDREIILDHPTKIVEEVDRVKLLMPDVADMIKSHHEHPEGDGYPRNLSITNISHIAALFAICETFVYEMVHRSEKGHDISTIKEELKKKFYKGNYKKVSDQFLKIIDKKFKKKH